MTNTESSGGRVCLFIFGAVLGFSGAASVIEKGGFGIAAIAFFGVGLGYSFLAALAVEICKILRSIAFPGSSEWDCNTAVWLGAFWPLSLSFWLIIAPFFAIINRLFT